VVSDIDANLHTVPHPL